MPLEHFKTWNQWLDYIGNPVIRPKGPEWIVGDPTFVPPNESPDGKWHLFAHGIIFGINHFISNDGLKWINIHRKVDSGMRAFLYKEDNLYYLFYQKDLSLFKSSIVYRTSSDLYNWSEARTVLVPSLPWEGKSDRKISNPCLLKVDGKYRLYYSGGTVFLWDCLFAEPKHIGYAEAKRIEGPYVKNPQPIISPSKTQNYRNIAAGAMKVLKIGDSWIGLNNTIYTDKTRHSRSSIFLLYSDDGIKWTRIFKKPIIYPTNGWKRAFTYQLDIKKVDRKYWLYYNARDGWVIGWESIGLAILNPK